jgi:methylase of polypeptide subunit release factors
MTTKSKLAEKGSRIPEVREAGWDEIFAKYLQEVQAQNNEAAKSLRFAFLLKDFLGIQLGFIEDYVAGIEKYIKVKQKDRILKGEADCLFGNLVIEFEANLTGKRIEAEEQLKRYVAILWSQEKTHARTPYLCLATDGVQFVAYSPVLVEKSKEDITPAEVQLEVIEEENWMQFKPQEAYFWLDRYFLRKEILHPTSETIVHDFGLRSHAFQTTAQALLSLWQQVKHKNEFSVVYDSWDKYLRIVYGTAIVEDELFIRHSYLATLAKLMSWRRITESKSQPDDEQILAMLEGRFFQTQGIDNFLEEDFFSWIARPVTAAIGIGVTRMFFSLLQNYNLRELSEDVLKSLYQELVDPKTRHDLGEFYTPDWLAHRITTQLLENNPKAAILDPACGSGTFLYLAIREKRERLGSSSATLHHILSAVYGADVHPLAVIVAKTNYILGLGDLIKKRKGPITIPIYLSDTVKLPERDLTPTFWNHLPSYKVELDGRIIYLPEKLLENLAVYDQAIELAKEFASQNKRQLPTEEQFHNFLQAQRFTPAEDQALVHALFNIAEALQHFMALNRDTIWGFVLKNTYKPLFFKDKFDFVIGNPPWLAYHFVEQLAYQTFLKKQVTNEYRLLQARGELITHLELATLFLVRAADLYLKPEGRIAFVLPRSLFNADQHDGLRKRGFKLSENPKYNLFFREIWDLEKVEPLFKVPTCVLFADKQIAAKMSYPIKGQIISGNLARKNAALAEAEKILEITETAFSLHTRGKRSFWAIGKSLATSRASYYKPHFAQGATMVPRSFWFVEVKPSPVGFNPNLPPLETSERAKREAKEAYKNIVFKDTVESRFLYATLLSTDLLPFGHLNYRLVVLPIESREDEYKIFTADSARANGFLHLARWLEKAQQIWEKRRGEKARAIHVLAWLDYRGKLTAQTPKAKYAVIYNTSGTYLAACVVKREPLELKINGQSIRANPFVANDKTYFYETFDSAEAYYLASVLNAPAIDKLIKPMQSRGLWGPRDIHKKVFELPIPQFDASDNRHAELVKMGKACSKKVTYWLAKGGHGKITGIGKLRGVVRKMLQGELNEINKLVEEIISA